MPTDEDRQRAEQICSLISQEATLGRFPLYYDDDERTSMIALRLALRQALDDGWVAEIKQRTSVRTALFVYGRA